MTNRSTAINTAGNKTTAQTALRSSETPRYPTAMARYIGLRVKRYGPRATIAVVGRPIGSTVVRALRKEITLAKPIETAAAIATIAAIRRTPSFWAAIGHGHRECRNIAPNNGSAKISGGGTRTPAWSFFSKLASLVS